MKAKKGNWVKVSREHRRCQYCGKEFRVLETSNQKFCSDICAGRFGFKIATKVYTTQRKIVHERIRAYVLEWSQINKGKIESMPFNKIKTGLQPLLNDIECHFGVKDIRVITRAVLGEQLGRKALLEFLKTL